jgi:hypothetical protein
MTPCDSKTLEVACSAFNTLILGFELHGSQWPFPRRLIGWFRGNLILSSILTNGHKMKYLTLSLLLVVLSASLCRAEMQFPLYESLSPEVQKAYGYVVQKSPGNNPGLSIIIPPAAAKYCDSARLYIRDGSKHILVETNMGLNRMKDGGLGINVNLFEQLHGSAELIIYTRETPGGPFMGDFGGFTFAISNGP